MKSNLQIILSIIFSLLIIEISLAQVPFGAPVIVENHWWNNNNVTIENEGPIISPGTPTSGVTIQGNSHVTFKSGSEIKLEPGFTTNSLTGNGYFHAQIEKSDFDVVAMNASAPDFEVGQFEKLELGIKLPDNLTEKINNYLNGGSHGINPYDPDKISVEATFTNGSTSKVIYGFYFNDFTENGDLSWNPVSTDYPWRIRFAPPETGHWQCSIKVTSPLGLFNTLGANNYLFLCVPSNNKGYIVTAPTAYKLKFSKTNQPFFAIGQNLPWAWFGATKKAQPCHFKDQRDQITNLYSNGGNYFRTIMTPWSTDVEWEKMGDYDDRQEYMWELDKIFELAHDYNLYIHLCLEMHGQYKDSSNNTDDGRKFFSWQNNPYNSINQNIISGINYPADFFSSIDCQNFFKKRLRYMVARWGYSTNLANYELFSEIDQIDGYANDVSIVLATIDWHDIMAKYIKDNLDNNHLITTSYSGDPLYKIGNYYIGVSAYQLNYMNIASCHHYMRVPEPSTQIDYNYDYRFNDLVGYDFDVLNINWGRYYPLRLYQKPYIIGEMGDDVNGPAVSSDFYSDLGFHNRLWSTTFMGGFGTGLNWWKEWDNNTRTHIKPLSSFINDVVGINSINTYITPNRSLGTKSSIECFTLINKGQSKAIGWLHKRSCYIEIIDEDPLIYYIPSTGVSTGEKLVVTNLQPLKKYKIDFYTTTPSYPSTYFINGNGITNNWGKLKIDISYVFNQPPGYNDFAYKIYRDYSFTNEAISMYYDTLDCPVDTITFDDVYNDDVSGTKFQYLWDFGNGIISTLPHPKVCYSLPGSYLVTCIVIDTKGFSDTLHQAEVVPDCDNDYSLIVQNVIQNCEIEGLKIYPNPNKGKFNIRVDIEFEGAISVYDMLGRLILNKYLLLGNKQAVIIDISDKAKGVYILKISNISGNNYFRKIIYN